VSQTVFHEIHGWLTAVTFCGAGGNGWLVAAGGKYGGCWMAGCDMDMRGEGVVG